MKGTAEGDERRRRSGRRSWRAALGIGLFASALVHAALVAFVVFPRPETWIASDADWRLRQVEMPPEVEIPPPPETFPRPAEPELTVVEVTELPSPADGAPEPSVETPVPEPPRVSAALDDRPAVAPPEVAPSLEAPEHFRRRLKARYPRMLRDRGVGGVVRLVFFVDPAGEVTRVEVAGSSGHRVLDRVASQLAAEMQFLPALNRDRAVGVWVSQRICFMTVERPDENPSLEECEQRVTLGGG